MWKTALILLLLHTPTFFTSEWGYAKDEDWGELDGECDGKFQSPIDLVDVCKQKNETVIVDRSLGLVFINYDKDLKGSQLLLENNGHTAEISLKGSDELNNAFPQLSGSAVGFNKFQLQQIHFHWNRNGSHAGSEHSLYGKKHAFEMHFVHFNTKYDAPDDASDHPDGSAVVSVLFDYYDCEEGGKNETCAENTPDNPALAPITKQLRSVDDADERTCLEEDLNLRNLLPRDTKTFFWYQGSLTTPPCLEDLTWIVFPEIQNISKRQLKSFEFNFKNEDGKVLGTTNREVQPLNGRLLLISRDDHCDGKDAMAQDEKEDNFAESTDIDIGAQQTVADAKNDGGDDDDDDKNSNESGDKGSSDSGNNENSSGDKDDSDKSGQSSGKDNTSQNGKKKDKAESSKEKDSKSSKGKSSSSSDDKKGSNSSGRQKREDDDDDDDDNECPGEKCPPGSWCDYDGDGKKDGPCGNPHWCDYNGDGDKGGPCGGDGSWCDYDADGDSDGPCGGNGPWCDYDDDGDKDGPCGWKGKGCSGKESDSDGCDGLCDRDGDGKIDGPCDKKNVCRECELTGRGNESPAVSKSPGDNGGVLSNLLGVNRPYGLYGNTPSRRKRETGHPSGNPAGDPPGDAKGANDPNDNGGVLSNAAGVDRPYGLYGNKPPANRRKRQTGHPSGPPTGNPAGDAKGANNPRDNGGVLSNALGVDRPYGLNGNKP